MYNTFQQADNKGAYQPARMSRLVCTFNIHIKQSRVFSHQGECLWNVVCFVLMLYVPVNMFSGMLGQVFLGWTSTKQRIKCLAQGHNAVPHASNLKSSTLPRSRQAPNIVCIILFTCTIHEAGNQLITRQTCLFDLNLYVPVNNLSVTSGRVFLSWTSTKLGLMCLAQGHNAVTPLRPERGL